jgi:TPR repeat protein
VSDNRTLDEQDLNFRTPLLLILLLFGLAAAASPDQMVPKSSETLRLHDKAEKLYRDGHWDRAYFIYVNELAAIGDKYAQYMAGYMSLTGKGVVQDTAKASAWYRLAAERGSQEFTAVRDQLLEAMSESDLEASDAAYLELRQQYSDLALAFAYLREEWTILNSRSPEFGLAGDFSVAVVDPATGMKVTRGEYARRLESRMQLRLDYITRVLQIDHLDPDINDREFEALAAQVDDYLQVINDR